MTPPPITDAPPDLERLHAIETAARALLMALRAYQDGLVSGTGNLELLYTDWLRAVLHLESLVGSQRL